MAQKYPFIAIYFYCNIVCKNVSCDVGLSKLFNIIYHDDGQWDSPTEKEILILRQDSVLLDDECDDGVRVQALQEHEHEAGREEEVDQDRLDPAQLEDVNDWLN